MDKAIAIVEAFQLTCRVVFSGGGVGACGGRFTKGIRGEGELFIAGKGQAVECASAGVTVGEFEVSAVNGEVFSGQ